MGIDSISDDQLSFITIIQQKEYRRDLMFTALDICAKEKYKENNKEYIRYLENLENENFLIANVKNLLATSIFLLEVAEYDDNGFKESKNKFIENTIALRKTTPTLYQFRVFFINNHEKIFSHIEKLNEIRKIRYFRRIESIINYFKANKK